MTHFLDIALRNAARGFCVFPVHQGNKVPCIRDFPNLATTDRATIERWAKQWPNANVGCMGDDERLIVDVDRWDKFQEQFADVIAAEPDCLDTYCISARDNRRQYTFLQTAESLGMMKRNEDCMLPDSTDNMFEFKSWHKFGVGEGSINKYGNVYTIIQDRPFRPVSAAFVTRAVELAAKYKRQRPTNGSGPREKIGIGGRRNELVREAGRIQGVTEMSKGVLTAHLLEFQEERFTEPLSLEEVQHVVDNCNWKPLTVVVKVGGKVLGETADESGPEVAEKSARPVFPDESWDGTIFGTFADIVCRGTFIRKRLASESFRAIAGAIAGDQVTCGLQVFDCGTTLPSSRSASRARVTAWTGALTFTRNLPFALFLSHS